MVSNSTNDENWRNGVLLTYTILLFSASVAMIVTMFIWFLGLVGTESCGLNMAIIVSTCVMFFLTFCLRCRKDNSLLT